MKSVLVDGGIRWCGNASVSTVVTVVYTAAAAPSQRSAPAAECETHLRRLQQSLIVSDSFPNRIFNHKQSCSQYIHVTLIKINRKTRFAI